MKFKLAPIAGQLWVVEVGRIRVHEGESPAER